MQVAPFRHGPSWHGSYDVVGDAGGLVVVLIGELVGVVVGSDIIGEVV